MGFCCLGELCRFVYVQVSVNSNTACVPHTLHVDLRFVPLAGRCMANHARGVGKDASYSLLFSKTQPTVS